MPDRLCYPSKGHLIKLKALFLSDNIGHLDYLDYSSE